MKLQLLLALLALMLLMACSGPVSRAPVDVESFSLSASLTLAKPAQKALYNPLSEELFALHTKDQEISIYKQNELKNVVGGLGTGTGNFLNLADITIAPDGALFALDLASRRIVKFTNDGKVMGSLELQNSSQPSLLAISGDQTLYVFDQAASEIVVYSAMDGTEQNRFGRFELQQLDLLSCNRDYVVGYDATNNTSHVFSSLGQFVKSEPGQTIYDAYNNALTLDDNGLTSQMSSAFLPLDSPGMLMSIAGDILVLSNGSEVRFLKIGYQQVE